MSGIGPDLDAAKVLALALALELGLTDRTTREWLAAAGLAEALSTYS